MSGITHLRPVPDDGDDDRGPVFVVQSWRRIVRMLLNDPGIKTLPCRRDMLLVAYDFAALCDVSGRGCYSSKERTGAAVHDRPDPSLCELTELSKLQVGKMLKLLIAVGALKQTKGAAMGRQAEYQALIPSGSPEDIGRCLAMAAELGFKPKARRDMTKQTAARKLRQAHREALEVLEEAPRMAVENPVENPGLGVMQTTPFGGHTDDPPEGRADDAQRGRTDDPPLPIGVLGNRGTTGSTTSTGPRGAETGPEKDDQLDGEEHRRQSTDTTIDGDPAGNRWGSAVSQKAIRQTGRERAEAEREHLDRCPGIEGSGCEFSRPVSPGSHNGLCIRCEGELSRGGQVAEIADGSLSFDTPKMPPPNYGTDGSDEE